MKRLCLRILLVLSLVTGFGACSSAWADAPDPLSSSNIAIEQWPGRSFTFLALADTSQAAGYEIFKMEDATRGYSGDRSVRLPYANYVGKQVTVTDVTPFESGYDQPDYIVHMKVNETDELLSGRTSRGQLEGLVLTADLDSARQYFMGKTVYPKFRALKSAYMPGQFRSAVSVPIKIGGPVTVVDVYAGERSEEPIWLIVSVNGEKAILPMAYSWTNISPQFWTQSAPWQGSLFIEDPRMTLGWSQELWNKIESGQVDAGMTKDQVHLSWGKPVRREANGSAWIYGPYRLNFSGETLSNIENIPESEQIAS